MSFWDTIWWIISAFFLVAYLIILFHVVIDLFRDPNLGGVAKAAWIVGLIFVPLLTAIAYVIARGPGMAERQRAAYDKARADTEQYIQRVAGKSSPADQIARAKQLLDDGAIDQEEFARLKASALA